MSDPKPRVLCVDDDTALLDGLRRSLRRAFAVETAPSGADGLGLLEESASNAGFEVVMSDLRMPGMDGIEFLSKVREVAPDATRILLTGNADLTAAMAAVNEGNIFRFLTKPCPADQLIPVIEAAAKHHRLVTAERVLLEQTLHGCVKMLTEVLALANPAGFGRATRIKELAGQAAEQLGTPERWKMEMAAMLSQVASIALPAETAERVSLGEELSDAEQEMVARLPQVAEGLLADIPRLEEVRAILRSQDEQFAEAAKEGAPVGARILKAALALDVAAASGVSPSDALNELRGSEGLYDPAVLDALAAAGSDMSEEIREVTIRELGSGMVLIDPVESLDGRLLVAHGQEVSVGVLERLRNFAENIGVKEPVRARVRVVMAAG